MLKARPLQSVLLLLMVAALPSAFGQQQQPEYGKQPERTITANPSNNNPVKGVDETDVNFMRNAAIGDEAEIQLGQMAQEKAASPAVKSFGQRMMKDHSDADDKLKSIAESQHISLPVELDQQHQDQSQALSRLSGSQFDRAYMQLMVKEHTQDVSKFQEEASNAHDPTVKQFATATLPVLQSHLQEAQQIQQQVAKE